MKTIENGIRGYHSDYADIAERLKNGLTEDDAKLKEGEINYPTMAVMAYQAAALYDCRWQAACEVIDIIAAKIGLNAEELGLNFYGVSRDSRTKTASSPLADRIDEYFDRSGDKVKLKKEISELKKENTLLRDMLRRQY
ncbi:MAG: hypothetical protein FWE08_03690 [Oscillospiraceae bacterium]|nr:hypothetical protein [Oscillospiraceae bacterium]